MQRTRELTSTKISPTLVKNSPLSGILQCLQNYLCGFLGIIKRLQTDKRNQQVGRLQKQSEAGDQSDDDNRSHCLGIN